MNSSDSFAKTLNISHLPTCVVTERAELFPVKSKKRKNEVKRILKEKSFTFALKVIIACKTLVSRKEPATDKNACSLY